MQEVILNENGDNVSKLIYFDCIKSTMTKDSVYDFLFYQNNFEKSEPLDPKNYNKDFTASIKGNLKSQNIFCMLYWKDISGRPYSARIKMILKN